MNNSRFLFRIIVIGVLLSMFCGFGYAQSDKKITYTWDYVDGETIPCGMLPTITVWNFTSKKQQQRITKLVKRVKKVYPYAQLAGRKLAYYENLMQQTSDKKERDRLMDQAEKDIKKEFSKDIKKMTFSEGRILIKLIDRETGKTSFQIVRELRGKLSAFFWQTFAKMFTMNLKATYDPNGEDKDIERIVRMIERGEI